MLTLVLLAGIDTDPSAAALFRPAPLVHVAPAAALTLEVPVLRVDGGVRLTSDLGAALYDLDGDADLGLRLGDDDLSLAFASRAGLAHERGAFLEVDGVRLPVAAEGTVRPHAELGAAFHIDLDDTELRLEYAYGIAAVHDAHGLARPSDVALWLGPGDVVPSHASHRLDLDARLALASLASLGPAAPELRDDLSDKSALLVAGAARHDLVDGARAFAWAGLGLALDGEALDLRAWAGPAVALGTDGAAIDVVGAIAAGLDGDTALTARLDRRLIASPFHARAIASGLGLALSTSALGLDVAASVTGAFVDVTGDDGVLAGALAELRLPLDVLVPMARLGVEVCAYADGAMLARAIVLVGIELQ